MVMAAGLGTRLRPLTYEVPKPMVPVANRPVMELLLRLLAEQGFRRGRREPALVPRDDRVALRDGSELGIELTYIHEPELTGTAGGVRAAREFLTAETRPVPASWPVTPSPTSTSTPWSTRTARNDGIATLATKRGPERERVRRRGHRRRRPGAGVSGEARPVGGALRPRQLHDLRASSPRSSTTSPTRLRWTSRSTSSRPCSQHDVPFHVHVTDSYWNDVGSLPEYLQGNLDVVLGAVGGRAPRVELIDNGDPQGASALRSMSSGPILIAEG